MKKTLTLLALSSFFQISAQCNYRQTLEFNKVSGVINANGLFFKDIANGLATYKPDKMSNITALFQSSFSVSGKDINGQDYSSVTTYDGSDFACGPIAINYSDQNYVNQYSNRIWSIYKSAVDLHIQNWNSPGYSVPPAIAQWPGNGDVLNGMPTKLAPYTDVNGNGIYDPVNGDYPDILGDIAFFLILNDQNSAQFPGTIPMNIELHCMFYQFVTTNALNTTTFVNVKMFNRGATSYNDVKFNVLNDFDLGNYADDFGGTDAGRNLLYVYNGDNMDEVNAGWPGYGVNPPAIGMISLNHSLMTSIFPDSIPDPNSEFLNVINGKNPDGTAILNTGIPTVLQYSDTLSTGYNEAALGNIPGDRRSFTSVSLGTLAPNSVKCLDFAWIFARKTTGNSLFKSVDSLLKVADFVQDFYDNYAPCMDGTLETHSLKPAVQFELYPNPSNGEITCVSAQDLQKIEVWNLDGKLIYQAAAFEKEVHLDLSSLSAGAYLIKLSTSSQTETKPFYKQ